MLPVLFYAYATNNCAAMMLLLCHSLVRSKLYSSIANLVDLIDDSRLLIHIQQYKSATQQLLNNFSAVCYIRE
jgi:hypothetical protein